MLLLIISSGYNFILFTKRATHDTCLSIEISLVNSYIFIVSLLGERDRIEIGFDS